MNSEESTINPSSLLDLKAELHKKYESFRKAKLVQQSDSTRHSSLKRKNEPIKAKKTVTQVVIEPKQESSEEDLALKKSRLALEAKAKIYEKITSNNILIDDEENERYLVDFQRKVLYHSPVNNSSEKEEKINSSFVSEKDTASHHPEESKDLQYEKPVSSVQCSNKDENVNEASESVHYQNVQFNEVRDHGTGYFAFSMDESKRKEQMDELNSLRQETEQQRLSAQKLKKKRKDVLQARLAKVCERRNIDKSVVTSYAPEDTQNMYEEQNIDLSSIPLPEVPPVTEKKEIKVRPWDVGKTNYLFTPEKNKIRSHNDWVEERRSERPSEFAPPSSYR